MRDALALTWTEHRRTTGLCAGLDLELVVIRAKNRGALRYLFASVRTIALLLRRRPDVLLVPNPSLVLATLAILLRPILRYRLVVDAHNEAVVPFIHQQCWLRRVSRWVVSKADLTIVSNRLLAAAVEEQGGRPFTLPDRIPEPPIASVGMASVGKLQGAFNAVLISTFAPDEPVLGVLEAVRGTSIDLYVTGDCCKLGPSTRQNVPRNVHLTGFLPEAEYWKLLRSADAIVDLTLMENCLVCGAYEALALGKPMLLSNNRASVEFFGDSALYTDNAPDDIRRMLGQVQSEHGRLVRGAAVKRAELVVSWAARAADLTDRLREWQGARPE